MTRLPVTVVEIDAASVRALKDSLDKVVGLPWVNTVAADRDGNTLYADASVVPHMNADKFGNGCLLLQAALRLLPTRR